MADPQTLPPVPYKSPVTNDQGYLNEIWTKFFRQVFNRAGGNVAPSNTELQDNIDTLSDSVSDLRVAIDGLNQGRQL